MRQTLSDEMDHIVYGKELKSHVVRVGKLYRLECLSSIIGIPHFVISNPGGHPSTTELLWSHHRLYGNCFYVERTAHTDTEAVIVVNRM